MIAQHFKKNMLLSCRLLQKLTDIGRHYSSKYLHHAALLSAEAACSIGFKVNPKKKKIGQMTSTFYSGKATENLPSLAYGMAGSCCSNHTMEGQAAASL